MAGGFTTVARIDGRLTVQQMMHRVYCNLDSAQVLPGGDYDYGQYFRSDEILYWLDVGYQYFLEVLRKSFEGDTVREFTYSIVNGQTEYGLPSDFMKAVKVLYLASSGLWVPMNYRFDFEASTVTSGAASGVYVYDYSFRETNIVLNPTPAVALVDGMKVVYQGIAPALQDTGQITIQEFLPQWQELIVLYATIRGFAKDGRDPGLYKDLLAKSEQSFREYLENRSIARQQIQPFGDSEGDEAWLWTWGA